MCVPGTWDRRGLQDRYENYGIDRQGNSVVRAAGPHERGQGRGERERRRPVTRLVQVIPSSEYPGTSGHQSWITGGASPVIAGPYGAPSRVRTATSSTAARLAPFASRCAPSCV